MLTFGNDVDILIDTFLGENTFNPFSILVCVLYLNKVCQAYDNYQIDVLSFWNQISLPL